jgi:hypothetical protein
VSVLHSRIVGEHYMTTPDYHPYGTAATELVMPMSHVTYRDNAVLYGTVHPLVTTDGATVPAYADVTYPETMPAGLP